MFDLTLFTLQEQYLHAEKGGEGVPERKKRQA